MACALMLAAASCSLAQDRRDIALFRAAGFNGVGGFAGTSPERVATLLIGLANYDKFRAELKLTPEQVASVKQLKAESQTRLDSKLDYDARLEAGKDICKRFSEILDSKQVTRLVEISVQVRSIDALADPDVIKELGITEEQIAEFAVISKEAQQKVGPLRSARSPNGQRVPEAQAKFEQVRKETRQKAIAVLTKEQQAKFEQMQGVKIEIDGVSLSRSMVDFRTRPKEKE